MFRGAHQSLFTVSSGIGAVFASGIKVSRCSSKSLFDSPASLTGDLPALSESGLDPEMEVLLLAFYERAQLDILRFVLFLRFCLRISLGCRRLVLTSDVSDIRPVTLVRTRLSYDGPLTCLDFLRILGRIPIFVCFWDGFARQIAHSAQRRLSWMEIEIWMKRPSFSEYRFFEIDYFELRFPCPSSSPWSSSIFEATIEFWL